MGIAKSSAGGRMDRWSVPPMPRSRWRPGAFPRRLLSLGIVPGDRVATMAMNSGRHLECWYGIMGIGAVCHTLNPHLHSADLEYIVNRTADCVIIVDGSLVIRLAGILPACPSVRHVVVIDGT